MIHHCKLAIPWLLYVELHSRSDPPNIPNSNMSHHSQPATLYIIWACVRNIGNVSLNAGVCHLVKMPQVIPECSAWYTIVQTVVIYRRKCSILHFCIIKGGDKSNIHKMIRCFNIPRNDLYIREQVFMWSRLGPLIIFHCLVTRWE